MVDEQEVVQQPEVAVEEPKPVVQEPVQHENVNWREMRMRLDEAERRNKKLEEAIMARKQEEPEEHFEFDDENLVEGKHVKKLVSKLNKELKETKKQLAEFSEKATLTTAEMRLNNLDRFKDIVNEDNLRKLAQLHPEDYASIMANPDIYGRGKTAYNMIKAYGIEQKHADVDKKIDENIQKPKSAASVGPQKPNTPLARVGEYDRRVMSEDRRLQILQDLEDIKAR